MTVLRKVGIEHHAHRAHHQATCRQHRDAFAIELNQAILGHALQLRPKFGEITLKIDIEGLFDLGEFQAEIADQLLNYGAAQSVIGVAQQATAGGQL
ncbi:hypothetical protein D3C76_1473530 [compost metagenome]